MEVVTLEDFIRERAPVNLTQEEFEKVARKIERAIGAKIAGEAREARVAKRTGGRITVFNGKKGVWITFRGRKIFIALVGAAAAVGAVIATRKKKK